LKKVRRVSLIYEKATTRRFVSGGPKPYAIRQISCSSNPKHRCAATRRSFSGAQKSEDVTDMLRIYLNNRTKKKVTRHAK